MSSTGVSVFGWMRLEEVVVAVAAGLKVETKEHQARPDHTS